jgi:hypothetical protein
MVNDIRFFVHDQKYDLTSKKPRGDKYYYQCLVCEAIIKSNTSYPCECSCGNITLDPDMFKISVNNYKYFRVLEYM